MAMAAALEMAAEILSPAAWKVWARPAKGRELARVTQPAQAVRQLGRLLDRNPDQVRQEQVQEQGRAERDQADMAQGPPAKAVQVKGALERALERVLDPELVPEPVLEMAAEPAMVWGQASRPRRPAGLTSPIRSRYRCAS